MEKKKLSLGKKILIALLLLILFIMVMLIVLKLTGLIATSWLGIFSPFLVLAFIIVVVAIAWVFFSLLDALFNEIIR